MTKLKDALQYLFLTIVSIISVFPLFWMVIAATNTSVDISRGTLLPGTNMVKNFTNLIELQPLFSSMGNSFRYATIMTLAALLVCSMAGYGFEVFHDRAKDIVMAIVLLTMMIPFVSVMIPLFRMFSSLDLLNTTLGFVLPMIASPLVILLFRQSARSFPKDIIEAARLDGLNEFSIFIRMFIPTMRSTYAAAAVILFMSAWNAYLWPKVVLWDNTSITMPMLISNLTAGYVTDFGVLMLGVLLSTIPTILIFFVLQKSFAEGITGSIK